jgi:hypothetical protein
MSGSNLAVAGALVFVGWICFVGSRNDLVGVAILQSLAFCICYAGHRR